MDKKRQKRNIWREWEITEMMAIIKNSYIFKLLDRSTKHNKRIFEDIAKELSSIGIKKNAFQIRTKFKALKFEYRKAKRSGADRQSCPFFYVFDEDLFSRPAVAAPELDSTEMSSNEVIAVDNIIEEESSNENFDNDDLNSHVEMSNASRSPSPTPVFKTFKASRKQTYEKVMTNFTEEWKQTQRNLIKILEKQEEKYIANMEKLMERNRNEMRKIMEEDRQETAKMFSSLLSSLQTTDQTAMPQWYSQPFPHVDVKECLTSPSETECDSEFIAISPRPTTPMEKPKPNHL